MKTFFIVLVSIVFFCIPVSADITWITPVDIDPAATATWTDADVTAHVGAGVTGIIVHVYRSDASSAGLDWGIRQNGSTDARINEWFGSNTGNLWTAIGIDGGDICEIYTEVHASFEFWLVGWFGSDATFNLNADDISLGTTGSWLDIDIATLTGGETAIAAIIEIVSSANSMTFGLRMNGSTDNRLQETRRHGWAVIGVDGSEILEGQISDVGCDFFLVGWIITDVTMNTNATDLSLGTTGSWLDLSALPAGATGGFIEVVTTNFGNDFGLRLNGSTENLLGGAAGLQHSWGLVEADGSQIIEGQISSLSADFFLVGYSTAAAAVTVKKQIIVY